MPTKEIHFKSIGAVTFFRNKRSRNMKISVKPDKSVRVSFPFFVSEKEVLAFLSKNEDWIRRQQIKADTFKVLYKDGAVLKTKDHTVVIHRGNTYQAKYSGSSIVLYVADFHSDRTREFIEKVLTEIYRFEARKLLPPRLLALAREYELTYNKVTIRNNKSNWGSCSSKNNISLNLQMMKLPDELIDYILLHELVHTEIKNHSPRFWEKLDKLTGHCSRELAAEVKKYSTYTL